MDNFPSLLAIDRVKFCNYSTLKFGTCKNSSVTISVFPPNLGSKLV